MYKDKLIAKEKAQNKACYCSINSYLHLEPLIKIDIKKTSFKSFFLRHVLYTTERHLFYNARRISVLPSFFLPRM